MGGARDTVSSAAAGAMASAGASVVTASAGTASSPDPGDAATPDSAECVGEVTLARYPDPSTPVSASEAACCIAYDEKQIAAAGDAGVGDAAASAFGADPKFVNCCKAIISGFGTGAFKYADASGALRNECCSSGIVAPQNELWPQAFCSPWGPPVPPALHLELEAVA